MTETLLALVPQYGLWLLWAGTFLSCLALPVPSSLFMLAAGGFVASGDLVGWQTVASALLGAVLGDQVGYRAGYIGSTALSRRLGNKRRARLMARAAAQLRDRGGMAVFLSRWLFSPLGPYVNFAGGAAVMNWRRFTLASLAGEAVWVSIYVGLGAAFASDIVAVAAMLGNASGFLAAAAVAAGLALWLRAALRQRRDKRKEAEMSGNRRTTPR
jgi:membrane protein DedA with SNARE-associated domain